MSKQEIFSSGNGQTDRINKILTPAGVTLHSGESDSSEYRKPWDIVINNPKVIGRIALGGTTAAGEAYMEGDWDCERIDLLVEKLMTADTLHFTATNKLTLARTLIEGAFDRLRFRADRNSQAKELAGKHYDLSAEFFKGILDPSMAYTCGYWKDADTLEEAQAAKVDLIARKLNLKPGMKVLDIGGGWGNFAYFAADKYKVNVTNISISKEQIDFAQGRKKHLPEETAKRVTNRIQDYRDVNDGPYDRIVSVGMLEHVRNENYRTFMETARRNLTEDGLMLLHCIGTDAGVSTKKNWLTKYIFPNSQIPMRRDVSGAIEGLFVVEDWHNFGAHYDRTLMEWNNNLERNWDTIKHELSDLTPDQMEMTHRMWNLYLLGCAGAFRSRSLQLWQVVLSPHGVRGGYETVR